MSDFIFGSKGSTFTWQTMHGWKAHTQTFQFHLYKFHNFRAPKNYEAIKMAAEQLKAAKKDPNMPFCEFT